MIAHAIDNQGEIIATNGEVGIAAGQDVLLNVEADESIAIRVGTSSGALGNGGLIEAARVALRAAGGNPYALAINHSGLIRANGVDRTDGRVVLSANQGITRVSGDIEAINSEGGTKVTLFSEDKTEFTGRVQAPGQGTVQISGVDQLVFDGMVDTQGGSLVLDPNNVEITSGAATLSGASTISAASVTAALATNNVVIHTSGSDGEDGEQQQVQPISGCRWSLVVLVFWHFESSCVVQIRL